MTVLVFGFSQKVYGLIKIKPCNVFNVITIKSINMVIIEANKDINATNVGDNYESLKPHLVIIKKFIRNV